MKRMFAAMAGAAFVMLVAGCSLMPADRNEPSSYLKSLDSDVIAAVESDSVRKGTQVYWINPPRKHKE